VADSSRRLSIRLLIVTVNTGLWTAIVALIELILMEVYADSSGLQWTTMEFPLCSLYISSFLASLNCREYVRGTGQQTLSWNEPPSTGLESTGHVTAFRMDLFRKDVQVVQVRDPPLSNPGSQTQVGSSSDDQDTFTGDGKV
jgi:hypothetical protein